MTVQVEFGVGFTLKELYEECLKMNMKSNEIHLRKCDNTENIKCLESNNENFKIIINCINDLIYNSDFNKIADSAIEDIELSEDEKIDIIVTRINNLIKIINQTEEIFTYTIGSYNE